MRRIVSLLPSATEIVCALGGGSSLVGVSHECDFPREAMKKPKIIEPIFDSGTLASDQIDRLVSQSLQKGERLYRINLDELEKADPDLIITQELCDVCAIGAADVLEAVNQLGKRVDVISLNPHSLTDVKQDIRKVADALGLGRMLNGSSGSWKTKSRASESSPRRRLGRGSAAWSGWIRS